MAEFAGFRFAWQPRVLSIVRVIAGLLFLEHGLAKIFDFPHQPTHKAFLLLTLVPGLQGSVEAIGGGLFTLGLATRPVAFILAGDMAVAYFMAHAPRGFFPLLNGGELAILYCFVFLYFSLAGGGAWSLDRVLTRPAPMPARHQAGAAEPWAVGRVAGEREPARAVPAQTERRRDAPVR
jgi:putative oxidoreductase